MARLMGLHHIQRSIGEAAMYLVQGQVPISPMHSSDLHFSKCSRHRSKAQIRVVWPLKLGFETLDLALWPNLRPTPSWTSRYSCIPEASFDTFDQPVPLSDTGLSKGPEPWLEGSATQFSLWLGFQACLVLHWNFSCRSFSICHFHELNMQIM